MPTRWRAPAGSRCRTGLEERARPCSPGLPLFHVNALLVTGLAPMFRGNRVVWPGPLGYRDPRLLSSFWRCSSATGSPRCPRCRRSTGRLLRVPIDADISALRLPIVGASALPSSVREGFARHTGRQPVRGVRAQRGHLRQHHRHPARTGTVPARSVGPCPGQQVKAVRLREDGSWQDCLSGEVGVLTIGGPAVFAGYLHRSRARRPAGQCTRARSAMAGSTPATSAAWTARVRVPHRPGQGPHHPRRPQHRPAR